MIRALTSRFFGGAAAPQLVLPCDLVFNSPWAIRAEAMQSIARASLEHPLLSTGDSDDDDDPRAFVTPTVMQFDDAEQVNDQGLAIVGSVAIVPVYGVLLRHGESWGRWITTYESIRNNYEAALTDSRVQSILFEIDSPGGLCDGCFELTDALMSSRGVKPVKGIANGCACSAAYAIASTIGAGNFYATRASDVGSIGVIGMVLEFVEYLKKEGVTPHIIKSGAKKDLGHPLREHDAEALAQIQIEIDSLFEEFLVTVGDGRGLSHDAVRALQAGVFVGARAIEHGLIDGVSTLEALLEEMNESPAASAATVTASGDTTMAFKRKNGAAKGKSNSTKPRLATEEDEELEDEDTDEEMEDESPDESAEGEEDDEEMEEEDEEEQASASTRSRTHRKARGKLRGGSNVVARERARITAINDKATKLGISTADPAVLELINSGASRADAFEALIDISAERGTSGGKADPIASMRASAPPRIGAAGGKGGVAAGSGDDLESLVSAEMEAAKQSGIVMSRAKAMRKVASSHPDAWRQANAKMHQDIGSLANNPNVRIVA